jgi:hypothetical protein
MVWSCQQPSSGIDFQVGDQFNFDDYEFDLKVNEKSSIEEQLIALNNRDLKIQKENKFPFNLIPLKDQETESGNGRGPLLLTSFNSFEELKNVVKIEYFKLIPNSNLGLYRKSIVRITQSSKAGVISNTLEAGISERDIENAKNGGFFDRIWLALNSPYTVVVRNDLQRAYALSRRREGSFGEGDVAFFDLAEQMMNNISHDDKAKMQSKDLSEKGYINTFNHVIAQSFMTSLFSERLADYIADKHELRNMAELTTGEFTAYQIADLNNGPLDNYIDIINNEWGQEIGEILRKKHHISNRTKWTPEFLASYLNDMQSFFSWVFHISFRPFTSKDELMIRFSHKINNVLDQVPKVR